MTEYVHVGRHADVLQSGRGVGPGDRVQDSELDDHDQVLIDEGILVDVASFDRPSSTSSSSPESSPSPSKPSSSPGSGSSSSSSSRSAASTDDSPGGSDAA